jgi:hypothetical protein
MKKKVPRWTHVENLSTIHPLLADVVYNRQAYSPDGNRCPLEFEVSQAEIFFIFSSIRGMDKCQKVLEIGCAMGISSLAIESALHARGSENYLHRIIDPSQETTYRNIGVGHLQRAGFSNWELVPIRSEFALPEMLQRGDQYDLIFQDGMHTFDHCLLEFHYLERMLRAGGLLLYDDIDSVSLNQFIRHISLIPHWKIVGCADSPRWSKSRKALNAFRQTISPFLRVLPRRLAVEFFNDSLIRSDASLGLNSSMIALQKVGDSM